MTNYEIVAVYAGTDCYGFCCFTHTESLDFFMRKTVKAEWNVKVFYALETFYRFLSTLNDNSNLHQACIEANRFLTNQKEYPCTP